VFRRLVNSATFHRDLRIILQGHQRQGYNILKELAEEASWKSPDVLELEEANANKV
jgi:hypothetical protein